MNKMLCLMLVVGVLTACEKSEFNAASIKQQHMDPLEVYLTRVAEEGIALLGDVPTRSGGRRVVDPSRIKVALSSSTRSGESDTLFYVVNFADSAGFALIDADTMSARPLFAVTEKGNYTPGEVTNTGFDDYVSLLWTKLPPAVIDTSCLIPPRQRVEQYWQTLGEVESLIPVQWDQGWPYNKFCPSNPEIDGSLCAAGCVAVAIAQIMAYHRHPAFYTMTWCGSTESRFIGWDFISEHNACEYESCIIGIEIALLIREIGHRVDMDYGTTSGANVQDARDCLDSFGYYRLGTRDVSWNLVQSELDLLRPLYIRGRSADWGRHAWVLDGYKIAREVTKVYEETMFGSNVWELKGTSYTQNYHYVHYNWGWGGNYNGLFYFGDYSPTSGVEPFVGGVEVVPGIFPIPVE